MRALSYWVVVVALLCVAGCSRNESTAPTSPAPQKQTSTPAPTSQPQPVAEPAAQDDGPGLAIGEQAPAFELQDQHSQPQSLAGILESGSAALVFYRSADW